MDEQKKLDKKKELESVIAQIEKQYGKGAIIRLGESAKITTDVIPTEIGRAHV